MSRTDRHIAEFRCDQCPEATGHAFEYKNMPCPPGGAGAIPAGWFSVSRFARETAHLCSAKCLQDWARGQGGSES